MCRWAIRRTDKRAVLDLKDVATLVLRYSPAQPLCGWVNREKLAVLAYHSVPDRAAFERQVKYLVRRYRPVSLAEVIESLEGRRTLPPRAVLVTFDDGDKTILENALPVMLARGMPGVLFLTVGSVDSSQPYWWDEAAELVARGGHIEAWAESTATAIVRRMKREPQGRRLAALEELRSSAGGEPRAVARNLTADDLSTLEAGGIVIENHTLTHPILDRCDDDTVAFEIQEAHTRLVAMLGREPTAFAYPVGYECASAREVLRRMGYRVAFLFDHRLQGLPIGDPLHVSRVRVNADSTADRLAVMISGLHPLIAGAAGSVE